MAETRMIKIYQRIYQATQIKAVVIKQLDLSVTGGSEKKKRTRSQLKLFSCATVQKHNRRDLLLLHLYDQTSSNICL